MCGVVISGWPPVIDGQRICGRHALSRTNPSAALYAVQRTASPTAGQEKLPGGLVGHADDLSVFASTPPCRRPMQSLGARYTLRPQHGGRIVTVSPPRA